MHQVLLNRIKRKFKVKVGRISKGVRYGIWSMKAPKNPQERLIIRIAKMMMEREDNVVFYSPEVGRIYAYTKDKKYIVVFDSYTINISNHNYFYTYGITQALGREIMGFATKRLENDRIKLEEEMFFNEKNFLNELHSNLAKNPSKNKSKENNPL